MSTMLVLGIAGAVALTLLIIVGVVLIIRSRSKKKVEQPDLLPQSPKQDDYAPPLAQVQVDDPHPRAVVQLAQQQLESLEKMEAVAEDPDLLFHLYRARHLVTRMNHEAELMQIKSDEPLRATTQDTAAASLVARSAVEGAIAFENVRFDVVEDFGIQARTVPALRNLLIQLLDRASEAERFGRVNLRLEKQGDSGIFEIVDHGRSRSQSELDGAIAGIQSGLNSDSSTGVDVSAPGWTIGAVIRDLPVEVMLSSAGQGSGTTSTVRLEPAGMDALPEIKRPVEVSEPTPRLSGTFATVGAPIPSYAAPITQVPHAPAAAAVPATPVLEPVTPRPIPPLYKAALDRLELESTMNRIRSENAEGKPAQRTRQHGTPPTLRPNYPASDGRRIPLSR